MSASNPFEMFEINEQAENEIGIYAEYPVPGQPNRAYKIRFVHSGNSNVHFRDALRARLKPLNFRINQDLVSDEEYKGIMKLVFADKIIKEWKSKDENGNWVDGIYKGLAEKTENFLEIIPFDKKNVVAAFEKSPRLFDDIQKQADSFATFKTSQVEDAIKN